MPLIKGKSPESFSKNVSTEMHAGKPLKQSLAIAYAMKKRAHKAHGGEMEEHCSQCGYAHKKGAHQYADGGDVDPASSPAPDSKPSAYDTMANSVKHALLGREEEAAGAPNQEEAPHDTNPLSAGMKKAFNKPGYADGGFIHEEKASGYEKMPHPHDVHDSEAMDLDDRMLNQHGALERGPEGREDGSDPGERMVSHAVENQSHGGDDMVGHIMKKRQMKFAHGGHAEQDGAHELVNAIMHKRKMMSEGGKVANDVGMGASADLEDNQFDDLVLRDDLESSYTGANSGDEIGNAGEDERRKDIVSKIMASRRKKDRLPRPA